jgi:tripartite-type tricarboxylate transporter receptor subunit TctC
MMRPRRSILTDVMVMAFLFLFWGAGLAAERKFPTRPIQVIIPFQPGETDSILRPFAEKIPEYLGQPVNFVYKPGAAGGVGAGFVAGSKPDGYTLVGTSQSSVVINPLTQKDAGYTWESFAPAGSVAEGTLLFAVLSNSRWKTIHDLVAEAKKDPGQITYATPGVFNIMHLAAEAFFKKAGIKLNHIPAQGSGPVVTACLGGHVDIAGTGLSPAIPHIKAGTMRALAIFKEKRNRSLPDVPTFSEMGYAVIVPTKFGFLAPKGTPREAIETFNQALKKAIENHQAFINDRVDKIGAQVDFMTPAEQEAFLKSQNDFFGELIRDLKP